jgi:hypothetical protein
MDTVRATELDGTVLNTAWLDVVAVGLNGPFNVIDASANRRMRSIADLSTPVVSCTPRGVASSKLVKSLMMARTVPPLSSTDSVVIPKPDCFAIGLSLLYLFGQLGLIFCKILNPKLAPGVHPLPAGRVSTPITIPHHIKLGSIQNVMPLETLLPWVELENGKSVVAGMFCEAAAGAIPNVVSLRTQCWDSTAPPDLVPFTVGCLTGPDAGLRRFGLLNLIRLV